LLSWKKGKGEDLRTNEGSTTANSGLWKGSIFVYFLSLKFQTSEKSIGLDIKKSKLQDLE
jgi:hypothetical protein